MPMFNSIKRRLVEHLSTLVNELHIGSDGTEASANDCGVRSLGIVTHTVKILDDLSLQIDGTFDTNHIYDSNVREVYLQYKDPSTGEFVPIYRAAIDPIVKSASSEISFSFIMEVD